MKPAHYRRSAAGVFFAEMRSGHEASGKQTLIGRNLDRLLRKHGMSQKELAAKTNGALTQADVSRIRTGETKDPSANKLRALAMALGEPLDVFWADPEDPRSMDPSLAAFMATDFASGVTDDEMAELASARGLRGPLSPAAWYHVLQAVRLMKAGSK
jgi:transcriptional regulator with XRE-family HTH domain